MDNEIAPHTANEPGPQRLALIFAHATNTVIGSLPAPFPDSAHARAGRDMNAIAQIAALVPANAAEVMVSVQFVVTNAQGLECLRRAEALPDGADAWRAGHQAATLLRISHAAANLLLRLQAARLRREATPASASSAALTECCAMELMLKTPGTRATPDAEAAERVATPPAEAAAPIEAPPAPEPEPVTAEHIAAAEAYAQSNPTNANRARILRRKRGMPNWGMFTPPAPEIVNALVHGHSPILDALLPGPRAY